MAAPRRRAGADDASAARACTACAVALAPVQAEFGVDARRRLPALHADHARLRRRRHPDGTPRRPLRRDGADGDRRDRPRHRASCSRAMRQTCWQFSLAHGMLIGLLGCSATFAPLVADTSLWFNRRRGIAVAICASGNYLAGAVWPPILQYVFDTDRLAQHLHRHRASSAPRRCWCWRSRYARGRPPMRTVAQATARCRSDKPLGPVAERADWRCSAIAGIGCCVAMSMPQVHIVAYCGDLGYGAARGARDALDHARPSASSAGSSRAGSATASADCARCCSARRCRASRCCCFLPFDGLVSLYVVSALFGLFQGGIVPALRDHRPRVLPPREAGARVGIVLMATLFGMALGGWMSGAIFDLTGSYRAAFINGIALEPAQPDDRASGCCGFLPELPGLLQRRAVGSGRALAFLVARGTSIGPSSWPAWICRRAFISV